MKPYVICHMNSSVDGRILGSRWRSSENRMAGLFERLHEELGGGSWLIDRVTGYPAQPCLTGCRARCLRRRRRQRRVSLLQRFRLTALRTVRSVFVDGLFRKRRPLDLEQTAETAWTTITLAIRQVKS
jgi:hypothetical protein